MIARTTKWLFAMGLASAMLVLVGCEHRTINQILAEPARYANRDVGITGNVVRSFSVLGAGAYQVDDGTGKMWVVAKSNVPREGARVGVKGKIQDGFNLGGLVKLPEVVRSGMVMIESDHRAR
jgi:RPA family protein